MRKVSTIAILTVRSAVRSRLFLSLVIMTLLTVVILPVSIKSDGTPHGHVRIALEYTLNLVTALLAVATVWFACRTAAVEIEERQVYMLVTKPVHRGEIWLGKWFGLLAINLALLAVTGASVYGLLKWSIRPSALTQDEQRVLGEEILVARTVVLPEPENFEAAARSYLDEMIKHGDLDKDSPPGQVLLDIQSELEQKANTVAPTQSRRWLFHLPGTPPADSPLFVRYHFSSPRQLEMKPVRVTWIAGSPGQTNRHVYTDNIFAGAQRSFVIPKSVVAPDDTLTIDYVNSNDDPPATVIFDRDEGISVLLRRGSFEMNLVKALLVVFFKLAVLAALGLTMGCLFSMPVAVFISFAIIMPFSFGDFVSYGAAASNILPTMTVPSALHSVIRMEFRILSALVTPVNSFDAFFPLPRGEFIPWLFVGKAFLLLVGAYSGCLALLGSWLFSRRELGTAGV